MDRIPAGELRGVERLRHLEDEAKITQNGLPDSENRKIVANLGGKRK